MSLILPSLGKRVHLPEHMDDFSGDDSEFERALLELRHVNRYLGGYRTLRGALVPFLRHRSGGTATVLDLGTGLADHPEQMVHWGAALGVEVNVTAIDANPTVVECAQRYLNRRLTGRKRSQIHVQVGDAAQLSYPDNAFDVVTASLFLHHFDEKRCVAVLNEMSRVASAGVLINDLHRHPLAYLGIRAVAAAFPVTPMFANDGPLSVRRAFTPDELRRIARTAGLEGVSISWHWAFRLRLSTLR